MQCDLQSIACGQCVRAAVTCSGYRNVREIRFQDENHAVLKRALKNAPNSVAHFYSPPLSIDLQARDVFFTHYVTSNGTCWDFLRRYYYPGDSPPHLTLAIEAVSLAYLWHQFYSEAALVIARERYILALRMTNKVLKFPNEAIKETTLLSSLLLDLFEKITGSKSRTDKSWTSHVSGAVALVKLRGLDQFRDPSEFRLLVRLTNHYLISCVASGLLVPEGLLSIRNYIDKRLDLPDYTLQLSDATMDYARLRSDITKGVLSNDDCINTSMVLDKKIEALEFNMPASWKHSTIILQHKVDKAFGLHFDVYPGRNKCLAGNILRVVRILLNETVLESIQASSLGEYYLSMRETVSGNIRKLVEAICASVPQYTDCEGTACERFPTRENLSLEGASHMHTPDHQKDCYTLIFPLYAAGRSSAFPDVRPWAIKQLHYLGSHFNVRNAELVAQILEGEADVCPWEVYAMLGCYAFTV